MGTVIGIMGPGERATDEDVANAFAIGRLSAQSDYIVLTGGRRSGVMDAGLRGAKEGGGQTIAILPSRSKKDASQFADIVIVTGMNSGRNYINALTADIIVACGVEAGSLSEIALALKEDKHVVLITQDAKARDFLAELRPSQVHLARSPEEAIGIMKTILDG